MGRTTSVFAVVIICTCLVGTVPSAASGPTPMAGMTAQSTAANTTPASQSPAVVTSGAALLPRQPAAPVAPVIPGQAQADTFGTSDALSYISTLVTTFGVLLTVISILFLIVSFFGFREILQIRELESKLKALMDATAASQKNHQETTKLTKSLIDDFKTKTDTLRQELSVESGKLIEAAYYFSAGETAYRRGEFLSAINEYKHALRFRPHDANILTRTGRAYVNIDRISDAKVAFDAALAIDNNDAGALYGLATVWRYQNLDEALKYVARACELQPDSVDMLNYLGLLHRDAGNIAEAIAAHNKALKSGANAITHFYLALLYAKEGNLNRAKGEALLAASAADEELLNGMIRPVWGDVIKWAVLVFEQEPRKAKTAWVSVTQAATTDRVRKAAASHGAFLCQALEASLSHYGGTFDADS